MKHCWKPLLALCLCMALCIPAFAEETEGDEWSFFTPTQSTETNTPLPTPEPEPDPEPNQVNNPVITPDETHNSSTVKETESLTTNGKENETEEDVFNASSSSNGSTANPTTPSSSSQSQQQSSPTSFTDVKSGDYYAAPVAWAVEKGITNGVDATHFAPTSPCNRGQMVTFLWRAAGSPEPKGDASKFTDVKAGEYYAKAVAWAVENNITLGTSETTFEPSSPVSRAQAVTFLWRAQGKPSATAGDIYADVEAGSYYEQAVQWAAAKNVTKGTGNGFEPSTTVNRAMSVTFLYRTYVGA